MELSYPIPQSTVYLSVYNHCLLLWLYFNDIRWGNNTRNPLDPVNIGRSISYASIVFIIERRCIIDELLFFFLFLSNIYYLRFNYSYYLFCYWREISELRLKTFHSSVFSPVKRSSAIQHFCDNQTSHSRRKNIVLSLTYSILHNSTFSLMLAIIMANGQHKQKLI